MRWTSARGRSRSAHRPVASLKWPAMTMDFAIANDSIVAGLKPGTAIDFEFVERKPGEWVITSVKPRSGPAKAIGKAGRSGQGALRCSMPSSPGRRGTSSSSSSRPSAITLAGIYAVMKTPLDALAGPFRCPGDHLHRGAGTGAAGRRRPDHLSAHHLDALGAEVEGGARLLLLRRFLRLRDLRGWHRHLLGEVAGSGISQLSPRGSCRAA